MVALAPNVAVDTWATVKPRFDRLVLKCGNYQTLADEIGVRRWTIMRWYRGITSPRGLELASILRTLDRARVGLFQVKHSPT